MNRAKGEAALVPRHHRWMRKTDNQEAISGLGMWINSKRWQLRWTEIERLASGGQGQGRKATRTEDGRLGFIKTINNNRDPERRARFFREAAAYESCQIGQVPSLIETNAHEYSQLNYTLYLAVDFFEGPTISEWKKQHATLKFSDAMLITKSLLSVIDQIHRKNFVHRDIKPDNIILRNGNPSDCVLLDFGLSYNPELSAKFGTDTPQELGNRFLRLPELSAGSLLKQDERTDLNFVAAIFYYLLVDEPPSVLIDAEGKLPHQRPAAVDVLSRLPGVDMPALRAFFDLSFEPTLSRRHSNLDSMLERLQIIENPESSNNQTIDDRIERIRVNFTNENEQRKLELISRFLALGKRLHKIAERLNKEIQGRWRLYCMSASRGVDQSVYSSHFWDEARGRSYGRASFFCAFSG